MNQRWRVERLGWAWTAISRTHYMISCTWLSKQKKTHSEKSAKQKLRGSKWKRMAKEASINWRSRWKVWKKVFKSHWKRLTIVTTLAAAAVAVAPKQLQNVQIKSRQRFDEFFLLLLLFLPHLCSCRSYMNLIIIWGAFFPSSFSFSMHLHALISINPNANCIEFFLLLCDAWRYGCLSVLLTW